jgi:hypothetical protein
VQCDCEKQAPATSANTDPSGTDRNILKLKPEEIFSGGIPFVLPARPANLSPVRGDFVLHAAAPGFTAPIYQPPRA